MDIEKIVREYIDKSLHMSLGTSANNKPWVCEVHFVYDDDLNLYFRSEPSRRHSQEIAENPSVAGNIVRQHGAGEVPHGIYFEGSAAMLTDAASRSEIFPTFQSRQGTPDAVLKDSDDPAKTQFYKIAVDTWYAFGRFDGDKVQKHELKWGR